VTFKSISARFGRTVRAHRHKKQLTQEQVAEAAGLHPTYVGMVERNIRKPTIEAAARIAKALRLPLWQLLRETETAAIPSRKQKQ
jgi:transcriptional regulator with XRE-family HTH domain